MQLLELMFRSARLLMTLMNLSTIRLIRLWRMPFTRVTVIFICRILPGFTRCNIRVVLAELSDSSRTVVPLIWDSPVIVVWPLSTRANLSPYDSGYMIWTPRY